MRIIRKHWIQGTIHLVCTLGFFWIGLFSDEFKQLSAPIQILIALLLALFNIGGPPAVDEFRYGRAFQALRNSRNRLKSLRKRSEKERQELHQLIARFTNHSKLYRDEIIEKLDLKDEFLCIMKSSEGFGKVWDKLEEKTMLPFTKVLSELNGSIRPFEKDGLFIIPISNLAQFDKSNIREFVQNRILPKVKRERKRFLRGLSPEQRALVDSFSFKYIAFVLKKHSLDYDTKNRKFNDAFVEFLVSHQAQRTISVISEQLEDFISGKEILTLVDWEAFAPDLNEQQSRLVQKYRTQLKAAFRKKGISNLSDISGSSEDLIGPLIQDVAGDETTKIKSRNLARKLVTGAAKAVRVLNSSGAIV